jgi:hypothetical protein
MSWDFAKLNLAAVDALSGLKKERDQVRARLSAMEAKRESVTQAVYSRVHHDYTQQLAELDGKSAPLLKEVRALYAELTAALGQLDAKLESARLDREEIEFRHSLGEFDEPELKKRLKAIDAALGEHNKLREQGQAVRQRFLAAVDGESELIQDLDEDTQRVPAIETPVVTPPVLDTPTAPSIAPLAPSVAPPTSPPPAAPATRPTMTRASKNPDATIVFRQGRLEPLNPEAGSVVQAVGLRPILVGSDASCDLSLSVPGIAKRHAEITMTRSGFVLKDLGGGSTTVNGSTIKEQLLADGDSLAFGAARFNFRLT